MVAKSERIIGKVMKRGKVLVSVVMSVYNDEQYLKESLDSIFAQTISGF